MSTKASPIKPEDIQDLKNFDIPSEMIEAVNELIIKNWNGSSATFKQKDLIPVYLSKVKDKEKARDMLLNIGILILKTYSGKLDGKFIMISLDITKIMMLSGNSKKRRSNGIK